MADLDLDELLARTREVVQDAITEGTISNLTPRLVRQEVETRMGLEYDTLSAPEYKKLVKDAAAAAVEEAERGDQQDVLASAGKKKSSEKTSRKPRSASNVERISGAKRKKQDQAAPPKGRKGSKAAKSSEFIPSDEDDNVDEEPDTRIKKVTRTKSRPTAPPSDEHNAAPQSGTGRKIPKAKRSNPIAVLSDEEDERTATDAPAHVGRGEETPDTVPATHKDLEAGLEQSRGPPKKRQKAGSDVTNEEFAAKIQRVANSSASESAKASSNRSSLPANSRQSASMGDAGERSESEMSVLIDEPKAKRGRKKGTNQDTTSIHTPMKISRETSVVDSGDSKSKRGRGSTKTLSKEEETIKRLKSLVVACGVRKVWTKEFKGLDRPADQIKRLKSILADLGMTGRLSMEQAKAIRERRELAKELEDVQEFEKSVVRGRSAGRVLKTTFREKDASEEESDEDMTAVPKRKVNAHSSIMAFLGDQSDDE
ncbi:hypothetical protein OBBRIDRAFT_889739 [Obba rivulosa]|uniref:Transcriptional regulator n=1 Tax=Obba rivulosa TaxID=1052685 RepID=A0A8E2DM42_9APHY|nr:hypothetical protein OBBRIDRAFT_889739 [Obba rivulosa]